jgi:hypothetical protein
LRKTIFLPWTSSITSALDPVGATGWMPARPQRWLSRRKQASPTLVGVEKSMNFAAICCAAHAIVGSLSRAAAASKNTKKCCQFCVQAASPKSGTTCAGDMRFRK